LFDDAGGFAAPAAQVIELGAAHLAAAHDLDRVDHRRIERKHALDPFAVRNLAHGEVLVEPAAGAADAHALIGLHAAAVTLDHLDVDHHGVAGREVGDFLAGRQPADLLLLDLFDEVHGKSPSRLAFAWSMISSENRYPLFGIMLCGGAYLVSLSGVGAAYTTPAAFCHQPVVFSGLPGRRAHKSGRRSRVS